MSCGVEARPFKKARSTTSSLDDMSSSMAGSSLQTLVCFYLRGSVTDDAFDVHEQLFIQKALQMGFSVAKTIKEVRSAFKGKRKADINDFDDTDLIQFLNNPEGIHHLFVASESRLARNTVLAGTVIALCKQHNITIHIVGVESPYQFVPSTGEGEQRLWLALLDAVKESEEKSKRAKASAQNRAFVRASLPPRPYEAPFVSADMKMLLGLMINGCAIQEFYTAFNKMLEKNPEQKERYGDEWIFTQDDKTEMTIIEKYTINLTRMIKTFSEWSLCRENKVGSMLKQKWTRTTLSEVIVHHFGQDVLDKINKKWHEYSDDEMEDAQSHAQPQAQPQEAIAAQPAVSGRVPHPDILAQREILCEFCQATNMYGHKFCHECATKIRY